MNVVSGHIIKYYNHMYITSICKPVIFTYLSDKFMNWFHIILCYLLSSKHKKN